MPELGGATGWLNSKPLTRAALRGKVVVVDFWTYSCINCLRALPYINAWYQHYKDSGSGDHRRALAGVRLRERQRRTCARPCRNSASATRWRSTATWRSGRPSTTASGRRTTSSTRRDSIRGHHFGEGKYARSERTIRKLLVEAGANNLPDPLDDAAGEGVSAAADSGECRFARDLPRASRAPRTFSRRVPSRAIRVKDYALPAHAVAQSMGARRSLESPRATRPRSRPRRAAWCSASARATCTWCWGRAREQQAGALPRAARWQAAGRDHGMDIDAAGQRHGARAAAVPAHSPERRRCEEHEFTIEFLDPHVEAYSFTFG